MANDEDIDMIDGVDVDLDLGDAFGGGGDGVDAADALKRDVDADLDIFDEDEPIQRADAEKNARGKPPAIDFSPPPPPPKAATTPGDKAPAPAFAALAKGKIPKKKKKADDADGDKKKKEKKTPSKADGAEEKPKKPRKKKQQPQQKTPDDDEGAADDDDGQPHPQKRARATRRKKYLDIKWSYNKGGYDVPHPKGGMAKMQEPKDATITKMVDDGSGTQQVKLSTDEFVCIVWETGSGTDPINGGLWRIEKMVQDGVSKNAMMRVRRYVLASSVKMWPEGTKTTAEDGSDIIVATQICAIVKTKYFANMVPMTVRTDGSKNISKGADDSEVSFWLDAASYAMEKPDLDNSGELIYKYVSPARDVPTDQSWTEFLEKNFFTTPEPGTSFRHEPGYSGQRTKCLRPPPGSVDAKPAKKRAKKTKDSTAADAVADDGDEKKKPKREKKTKKEEEKKKSEPAPAPQDDTAAAAADAPAPVPPALPDAEKKESKKKEHKKKEHKKKHKHHADEEAAAPAAQAQQPGVVPVPTIIDMAEPEKYMIELLKTCVHDIPIGGSATAAQRNMIMWAANGLMTFAPKPS